MIEVYKIFNGLVKIEPNCFFTENQSITRGHSRKLYKHCHRLDMRKNTFSQRIINDWNSLMPSIIESPSLDSFKKALDTHWMGEQFKHDMT